MPADDEAGDGGTGEDTPAEREDASAGTDATDADTAVEAEASDEAPTAETAEKAETAETGVEGAPGSRVSAGEGPGPTDDRCDFCRMPCPDDPVVAEHDGVEYSFCCPSCRDAMLETETVFTQYHGFRKLSTGVDALDAALPQGMPRNSFVMLSEDAGSRLEALQTELVWRALERGEPAVFVSFLDPPVAVVQRFVTLGWNVLPYLDSGQFHILDCFTYRMGNRGRALDRMDEWNQHLHHVAENATTTVRDPSDTDQITNGLDSCLGALDMADKGVVVIDSLTEFGTLVQPVQAYTLVKDVRADVSKGRFVPVFAGATRIGDVAEFPHDLGYIADGIVELRLNGDIVADTLLRQLRTRKMVGVLSIAEWHTFEYTAGEGLVVFDAEEEMAKSEAARARNEGGIQPDLAGGAGREVSADESASESETDAEPANDPAAAGDDEGTAGDQRTDEGASRGEAADERDGSDR